MPIPPPPALHRLHPADLPPGTEVGSWRVLATQGQGASGTVYRAVPIMQPDGPSVALKLALQPGDPRFLREAELLRRIAHPSVPRLHDHGLWAHPAGPFPFLVMDWVEGVPLYAWAHGRALCSREVLWTLAPVAGALAAAHAAKCVHRDVKGDNILVRSEDSRPMLLDFGAGDFVGARTLTREVLPPGTPYYRSPEALRFQWLHRHQDALGGSLDSRQCGLVSGGTGACGSDRRAAGGSPHHPSVLRPDRRGATRGEA